jgi:hypothetical protein
VFLRPRLGALRKARVISHLVCRGPNPPRPGGKIYVTVCRRFYSFLFLSFLRLGGSYRLLSYPYFCWDWRLSSMQIPLNSIFPRGHLTQKLAPHCWTQQIGVQKEKKADMKELEHIRVNGQITTRQDIGI